jgi:hypothetical protein
MLSVDNAERSNMSMIFRTKDWMTVGQLVRDWAGELAAPGDDPKRFERDLLHTLMEDIVNGRLDNSGPFSEDQRSGLRLITPENKAGFIGGHQLRDLTPVDQANRWVLEYVLVMREAVLDFAKRRQLSAPSWWTNGTDTPTAYSSTGTFNAVPITKVEPTMSDYKVGYGRPPKSGQFRRGKTGNPGGRPKGSLKLATDLAAELNEQITVREDGRARRVSKQRALIKSLMAKALQGDVRANTAAVLAMYARVSASSRLFDLNGEASTARTNQISAIIAPT